MGVKDTCCELLNEHLPPELTSSALRDFDEIPDDPKVQIDSLVLMLKPFIGSLADSIGESIRTEYKIQTS